MKMLSLSLVLVSNQRLSQPVMLASGDAPLRIKAVPEARYLLVQGEKGAGPAQLSVKRTGNDLSMGLPGDSEARLVIVDFYLHQGEVGGLDDSGGYHTYIHAAQDDDRDASELDEGEAAFLMMSSDSSSLGALILPESAAMGFLKAASAFAGLLALGGIILSLQNQHSGPDNSLPSPAINNAVDGQAGESILLFSGAVTGNPKPPLTGSGHTPGHLIEIYNHGALIGTSEVDIDGRWTFVPPALEHGHHRLTALEKSPDGKISPHSEVFELEVDLLPPDVQLDAVIDAASGGTLGPIETDGIGLTNDARALLQGTAEPGSLITLYDGATVIGSVLADARGQWVWQLREGENFTEGVHTLKVTATDAVGNTSSPTAEMIITVDTQILKPSIDNAIDAVSGGTEGNIDNDGIGITNDPRPVFTGTAEKGSLVTVYDGNTPIGSAQADDNGMWRWQSDTQLDDGTHQLIVIATDAAGNVSVPSDPFIVNVDTLIHPPTIISILDSITGGVEGRISNDGTGLTNDARPVIAGTAEPHSLVTIYDGATAIASVTAGDAGAWTWQSTTGLPEGAHTLTVVATDPAGNVSAPSKSFTITVDTLIPRPTIDSITDAVAGGVHGPIGNDGTGLTNDARPSIAGTAEPGSLVTIYDGATAIASVTAGDAGAWTWQTTTGLPEGAHTLTVVATDPAGNVSAPSKGFTITVDTLIPRPTIDSITDAVAGGVHGPIGNDGTGLTNDARPAIAGTAEPGSLVTIYDGATAIASVTAGDAGAWTWQSTTGLPEGAHTLTVVATDPAGNVSAPSASFTITVDTLIPRPTIDSITDAVNGGAHGPIGNDGTGLTNDARPAIAGTAEPGSLVTIYDGATAIASVTAGDAGAWTWQSTIALPEGAHTLTVVATDPAGNVSAPSASFTITVDTLIPRPTIDSITDAVAGGVHGAIGNDGTGLTNDARPVIAGTAEPGSLVTIYDGATAIASVTAGDAGAWTWQSTTGLPEGAHTLTVVATDPAGNVSAPSASFTITVDTLIPRPTIDSITDAVAGGVHGPIGNDGTGLTNDARPVMTGSAEKGSLVTIYDGDKAIGSVVADITTGTWTWQSGVALGEGAHALKVLATDSAGNVSESSLNFVVTVDTIKPLNNGQIASSTDTSKLWNGPFTDDTRPQLSGSGEPGAIVTIFQNGVAVGTRIVDINNLWSWQPEMALADGSYDYTIRLTDLAGNFSDVSTVTQIIVDTSPPSGTAIILAMSHDSGYLSNVNDFFTDDGTPGRLIRGEVRGTLNTNEYIQISVDGGINWHDVMRDPNGGWYWFDGSIHGDSWSIHTRIIDNLGRTGPVETQQVIISDAKPEAPFELTYTGQDVVVHFSGNETEKGGQVSIKIGENYYLFIITDEDIEQGFITVTLPAGVYPDDTMLAAVVNQAGKISDYRNVAEVKEIDFSLYSGNYNFAAGTVVDGVTFNTAGHFHKGDAYSGNTSKGWILHFWGGKASLDLNRNELGTKEIFFQTRMFERSAGSISFTFYDKDNNLLGTHLIPNASSTVNNLVEFYSEIPIFRVEFTYSADISLWDFNITRSYTQPAEQEHTITDESQYLIGSELNDIFLVNHAGDLDTVMQLSGGKGIDTLKLTGANQVLDFTKLASKVSSVEIIDITGSGDNTLNLSLNDVLANGQMDLFSSSGNLQLMVKGNSGDVVNLSDLMHEGADQGDWYQVSSVNITGTTYQVWHHSGIDTELLVENGITVNLLNH